MPSWVTLAEAKAALGETSSANDAELVSFIDAACQAVDRDFGPIGPQQRTEWLDGGDSTIVLQRAPVASVTSVTEYAATTPQILTQQEIDSGTFDDYGYRINTTTGILTRTNSNGGTVWFATKVKVVYTAGYSTIPDDAKRGTLELIRHLWETQRGKLVAAPGYDDTPVQLGATYSLPNRVAELLLPFRMPRI